MRRCHLVLLFCLAMLGPGCAPQSDFIIGISGLGWSERLRPDLGYLETPQRTQTLTRFSDGGPTGANLVSPLYPDIPEVAAGTLVAAPTLWVRYDTRLMLSYEMILFNPLFNGQAPAVTVEPYGTTVASNPPRTRQAAVSALGATVPMDRRFLVGPGGQARDILNSHLINGGLLGYEALVGVALDSCEWNGIDPPVALIAADGRPGGRCNRTLVDARLCGAAPFGATLFPATVLRCPITIPYDSTLRLRVVDVNNIRRLGTAVIAGTTQPPMETLPDIKVVRGPRFAPLAATFLREECRAPASGGGERDCNAAELDRLALWRYRRDPAQWRRLEEARCQSWLAWPSGASPPGFASISQIWTASVADPTTGRFRENFIPGIRISQVKFEGSWGGETNRFVLRHGGPVAFASDLVELRMVIDFNGLRIASERCQVTADPTQLAMVDAAGCPAMFARQPNPAWAVGNPEVAIEWQLTFREVGEAVEVGRVCNPTCGQAVVANGTLRRDLVLRPAAGDRVWIDFVVE